MFPAGCKADLPHGGKLQKYERTTGTKCCFSSRAYSGASVPAEQNAAAEVAAQEIMRMTRHGDGGYFRGGEERTGGGILQGKQLSRGEEAALI